MLLNNILNLFVKEILSGLGEERELVILLSFTWNLNLNIAKLYFFP